MRIIRKRVYCKVGVHFKKLSPDSNVYILKRERESDRQKGRNRAIKADVSSKMHFFRRRV